MEINNEEVYAAAVEVSKRIGYRNLTRIDLVDELITRGVAPANRDKAFQWAKNYLRGDLAVSVLRYNMEHVEEGLPEHVEQEKRKRGRLPGWAPRLREMILESTYGCMEKHGVMCARRHIVESSGFSAGTVSSQFDNMEGLRRAALALAEERGNTELLAQGRAVGLTPRS